LRALIRSELMVGHPGATAAAYVAVKNNRARSAASRGRGRGRSTSTSARCPKDMIFSRTDHATASKLRVDSALQRRSGADAAPPVSLRATAAETSRSVSEASSENKSFGGDAASGFEGKYPGSSGPAIQQAAAAAAAARRSGCPQHENPDAAKPGCSGAGCSIM